MFVCSRQEEYIKVFRSFISSQHVGSDGGIRMTYMWYIVDIVNGCCKIKGVFTQGYNPFRRDDHTLFLFDARVLLLCL